MELRGWRATLLRVWFVALYGLAGVAALGYLMPAHRVVGEPGWHSNYRDGGPLPLLVLALVAGSVLVLQRRRFGTGIVAGLVAAAGAAVAVAPIALTHFLSNVEYGLGEPVFYIAELGLFFGGAALVLVEPLLYVTDRRRSVRSLA